ncbi:MAG: glycosyltransferase family 39 protein [Nitrospirota bacterium]|nr:glycosyltransferase family 39 protein [Nitrospirota bacterium]
MTDAIGRKGMLLLFLFSLVLNLPYINVREFQGEEGRRVNIAATMLQTGDWVIPHVEGAIYLKKPPFYNWVLAAFFKLTGTVSEAVARIPSALAAFFCAAALSLFWRRSAGSSDAWFILPGLVFLTFPDVMDKAVRAEIDMTFTLFTVLSLLAWFYLYEVKRNESAAWIVSLSLVGVSTLTKGIQAPFFYYCTVAPYLLFYRRNARGLFSLSHLLGIVTGSAVFLAWLLPVSREVGIRYLGDVWLREILVRGEPLRKGGFLLHFVEFPFSYLIAYAPWVAFLLYLPRREGLQGHPMKRDLAYFCALGLVVSIPLYWMLPGARLRYLLPLSGMLALLITIAMQEIMGRPRLSSWLEYFIKALGAALAASVLASPLWGRRFDLFENAFSVVLMAGVLIAGGLLAVRRTVGKELILNFLVTVLLVKLFWASFYFPYHAKFFSHYRSAAKEINELVSPGAGLCDYGIDSQHLVYYLKRPVTLVNALTPDALQQCDFVFVKEGSVQEPLHGLHRVGAPVKARKIFLELYAVGKQERPFQVQ